MTGRLEAEAEIILYLQRYGPIPLQNDRILRKASLKTIENSPARAGPARRMAPAGGSHGCPAFIADATPAEEAEAVDAVGQSPWPRTRNAGRVSAEALPPPLSFGGPPEPWRRSERRRTGFRPSSPELLRLRRLGWFRRSNHIRGTTAVKPWRSTICSDVPSSVGRDGPRERSPWRTSSPLTAKLGAETPTSHSGAVSEARRPIARQGVAMEASRIRR